MSNQRSTIRMERIETAVERWRSDAGIPGVGVAVVGGEGTLFEGGFGDRRLDPDAPATADTLFGIGSATKPVTATAVLTLVDSGDLALDDAVSAYVPYFEDVPGEPVTVHELLSHTSGLPADDEATLTLLQQVMDADAGPPLDEEASFRSFVEGATDRRRLDDRFRYYNSGYAVLAAVVEAVTDTAFPAHVEQAVFEPLGIEDATFDADVVGDDSRDAMTPYLLQDGEPEPATLPAGPGFRAPGGLLASVSALGTFLGAQIAGGPVLSSPLRERMFEPVGVCKRFVDGTTVDYGYGWELRPFDGETLAGHSGGTAVSSGYVGFLREAGLGIAIGCNASAVSPEELAVELLAELTNTDPAAVLPERAVSRIVDSVTGRYESYRGVHEATVEWTGSRLRVEHDTPMESEQLAFAPASLDPEDPVFERIEDDGTRAKVSFDVEADPVELEYAWRVFRRVGDLDADEEEFDGSTDDSEDTGTEAAERGEA